MNTRVKASIVVRCYNEEEHIGRFLTGMLNQETKEPFEIIVVDSGSTDATLSIAGRYPVKIMEINSEEFSFGYSLNVGCRKTEGEFIVIASAHVYPLYSDWLEKMLLPFDDPSVGLVYGRQMGNETSKYSEKEILEKWFPETADPDQKHPFCNNANAAVRKSLWARFPYDETLTGLEDLDFAKRIMEAGYKIYYQPDAEIIHVHNETLPRLYNRYKREAIAFKKIFPNEKFSLLDFLKMFFFNTFSDYFHAAQDRVFWKNVKAIPAFRLMQFFGTYRGFAQSGTITGALRSKFYYPNEFRKPRAVQNSQGKGRKMIKYSKKNSQRDSD